MNVVSGHNSQEGLPELDSHADTTAAGSNMIMRDDPEDVIHHVSVSPFSDDYEPIKGIPIAWCTAAWTDPESRKVWILVFNRALFFWGQAPERFDMPEPNSIPCFSQGPRYTTTI